MSEWVGECAVLSVLTTSPPFGIELHDLCMLMLLHSVLVVTLLLQCDLDVAARPLTGGGGCKCSDVMHESGYSTIFMKACVDV
jgi:hypothetical protein